MEEESADVLHDQQSGFRAAHSTESAMLDLQTHMLELTEKAKTGLLMLLDLSAAFDLVDHQLLQSALDKLVGCSTKAQTWLASFLNDRMARIHWDENFSKATPILLGVPQGASLSPLLFNLYIRSLCSLLENIGVIFTNYADDTQLIFGLTGDHAVDSAMIEKIYNIIDNWMQRHWMCLNTTKTELMIFGSNQARSKLEPQYKTFRIKDAVILVLPKVKTLGMMVEASLGSGAQWLLVMVFAIEEINSNPKILPNVTLGFHIYDSCGMLLQALEGTLWLLSGRERPVLNNQCWGRQQTAAIIGESTSTRSILLARSYGPIVLFEIPVISYASTHPHLSDRKQFPSFFRTIPSDEFQSRGLADLVMHFGWTWVGLVAMDDDYGQEGLRILQEELAKGQGCVAFSENIVTRLADKNAFHIVKVIKSSTAVVIVLFATDHEMTPLLDELVMQNVTGKIWIASEGWSTSSLFSMGKYSKILSGTIGFQSHSGDMPGVQNYLSSLSPFRTPDYMFIREFWEEAFGCKWMNQTNPLNSQADMEKLCTGVESLESVYINHKYVTSFRFTYNVYTAVYAIAMALHDLMSCRPGNGPFDDGSCADILNLKHWQLFHSIKNVHMPSNFGTGRFFDDHGNPPAWYDIVNWQETPEGSVRQVKVGTYDSGAPPDETFMINGSAIQWAVGEKQVPVSVCSASCPSGFRKIAIEGQAACCYQCLRCTHGEISQQIDSLECSRCPWDQWPNTKQDQCIPRTMEFLSYEEPLGATMAAISIVSFTIPIAILGQFFRHRKTPIVRANNRTVSYLLLLSLALCFLTSLFFIGFPTREKCLLRQSAFGITFALCISCILSKTIMVVIAFNATKPNSNLRKWVGPQISFLVIISGTLFQVLLCVLWLIVSSPFAEYNIHTHPGKIIVECNEGSPIAFWCMLGYLGLLATASFIIAFIARKLPDTFNEAQFITFSMLAFLSVWLSFIPAYLSTRGKYMAAMEIFAIFSSSSALLCCLFFPKCYIMLLRPEMNSKELLLGAGKRKKET
ncbi:extracellular calcium-sensing receptor-like [Ambystoma mexicanum]|uniref:extracellular calcium-sensing receptor-like n=1 Tax=Ambystoma mexicanum TaxID=8296 RepID=UPI0037E9852A